MEATQPNNRVMLRTSAVFQEVSRAGVRRSPYRRLTGTPARPALPLRGVNNEARVPASGQVREELHELATGVTGVPFFIFNGKMAVSGAQDPAVFKQALLAS